MLNVPSCREPAPEKSFAKGGESPPGPGPKTQGKGSSLGVWLLQKGDSVLAPAGVAPACHRVTHPRVMETLTQLLTSASQIAVGN